MQLNAGGKFLVSHPELEADREEGEEFKAVGDIAFSLFCAAQSFTDPLQFRGIFGKNSGALIKEGFAQPCGVVGTGDAVDRAELTGEVTVGPGVAEDIVDGHAVMEPGIVGAVVLVQPLDEACGLFDTVRTLNKGEVKL